MDKKTLLELEVIQAELSASIGLIDVIADGLSSYDNCALEDEVRQKYVTALGWTTEKLRNIAKEFGKRLPNLQTEATA